LAAATAEHYARAARVVAEDPGIDAVIAIFLPPLATRSEDVAPALAGVADGAKPLVSVFMVPGELPDLATPAGGRVPVFRTPEPAAIALGHAVHHAEWLAQPSEPGGTLDGIQHDEASQLLIDAVAQGGGWLEPAQVRELLQDHGVPLVAQRIVATPDEAGAAAVELGGQAALKAIAPGLVHKTEAGAVR